MVRSKSFPEKLPLSSEDLIKALDAAFPHRCIQPVEDLHEALAYSGARTLIDSLLKKLEEDKDEDPGQEEKWYDGDPDMKQYIEGQW